MTMKRKEALWIFVVVTLSSSLLPLIVNWAQAPDFEGSSSFFVTSVSSVLTEDTHWTVAESPYVVTDNIIVDTNIVLTIEPGVMVKFAGYNYLLIRGTLNAIGCTFTSNASSPFRGDWHGIQSSGFSSVLNFDDARIEYAHIGIYINNANITIANSEISSNNIGISYFQHSHSNAKYGKITDNKITSNGVGVAIDIEYGPIGNLKLEENVITFNNKGVEFDFFNRAGFNVSVIQNVISLNDLFGVKIEGGLTGISYVNISQNYITFNRGNGIYLNLWEIHSKFLFFVEDNDVHSNADYNLALGRHISRADYTFKASLNYWGTNDTTRIDEEIYDFYDDHSLGKVSYAPILDSPLESRYSEVIDRVKPTIFLSSPLNDTYLGSSNVSILWNGYDAGSGTDRYAAKLDDNQEVNIGAAQNYILEQVSEGSHTVFITAFDKAGNIGEAAVSLGVDLTPPVISEVSIENGSTIRSSLLKLTWNGSDTVSSIDHYEIRLDTGMWVDVGSSTDYDFAHLTDGKHTIAVRAFDRAENSKEITISLVVNTSLLLGPGWIDDIILFGGISMLAIILLYLLLTTFSKGERRLRSLRPGNL